MICHKRDQTLILHQARKTKKRNTAWKNSERLRSKTKTSYKPRCSVHLLAATLLYWTKRLQSNPWMNNQLIKTLSQLRHLARRISTEWLSTFSNLASKTKALQHHQIWLIWTVMQVCLTVIVNLRTWRKNQLAILSWSRSKPLPCNLLQSALKSTPTNLYSATKHLVKLSIFMNAAVLQDYLESIWQKNRKRAPCLSQVLRWYSYRGLSGLIELVKI